jgi:hypothetical protein
LVTMVVEDGTGKADANSYGSLADAYAYHEARGNTAWTSTPPSPESDTQKAALIRATSYIDGRYGAKFPGTKKRGREQALAWPREDALDRDGYEIEDDEVPAEVERATFEAALRELVSPNSLNPDVVMTDRVKSEKVDVIAVEYAASTQASDSIPVVGQIDDILAVLIGGAVSSTTEVSFLERA